MSPTPPAPRGPLVVRFGAMGDLIMLTALLRGLAERWGRPCDVVAGAGGAPRRVFAGLPTVAEVFTLESRRIPYPLAAEQWRLASWLRRRGPSPAYVLEELPKVFSLLRRGGLADDDLLSPRELPRDPLEHAVAYQHRLLRRVPAAWQAAAPPPLAGRPPAPELAVSAIEVADCRAWLAGRQWRGEPLVLLQTRSRRANRGRWPEERWVTVARGVLARLPAARVLLTGSPAEEPAVRRLAAACADPRVEAAAADLPLRRLFALATLAHSCISLDTGPAHAAAALGCPLVVLMGRADPRRVLPIAAPGLCRSVVALPEAEWPDSPATWAAMHRLAAIPVEPVLAAWEALPPRREGEA